MPLGTRGQHGAMALNPAPSTDSLPQPEKSLLSLGFLVCKWSLPKLPLQGWPEQCCSEATAASWMPVHLIRGVLRLSPE